MCEKLFFTLFFYCSYALVHYSCPTNSARGAGLKKKKKKKTQTLGAKRGSKPNLSIMNYLL